MFALTLYFSAFAIWSEDFRYLQKSWMLACGWQHLWVSKIFSLNLQYWYHSIDCYFIRIIASFLMLSSKQLSNSLVCAVESCLVFCSVSIPNMGNSTQLILSLLCRYFMYDGRKHVCIEDDHIVNIFSFSKAYGMMGWRVGYVSSISCGKNLSNLSSFE